MQRTAPTLSVTILPQLPRISTSLGDVFVATPDQISQIPSWSMAYSHQRKDRRYYEIVDDAVLPKLEHGYFVLTGADAMPGASGMMFQPFFVIDQDMAAGAGPAARSCVELIRRAWPGFLRARMLMVGCVAGEGHLDDGSDQQRAWAVGCLREAVEIYARQSRTWFITFKEFPASYRRSMSCLSNDGYTRIPSMPMARLALQGDCFEEYMSKMLSKATRKDLRRKFREAERAAPITLQVVNDITPYIDEVYPLYLQVYERSTLRFEKLTPQFMCRLGQQMPERARFFIWRQRGKAIAFSLCLVHGDAIYDEYLGLEYAVALDLHLYFYTMRDILEWAMSQRLKWYYSSALNYEPKRRLRCELVPLDLYVRHRFRPMNYILRRALKLLEPTRSDKTLRQFPNYASLWNDPL
jgi:hypothetical protein